MSQANAEIVRRLYRAMDSRDRETILSLVAPDAQWIPDRRVGVSPIQGRDELIRFFADRAEMFDELRVEIEELRENDDGVVLALIRVIGHGGESGAGFEIRIAHLWELRDELIVRGRGFGDREQARVAAGLSE